MKYHLPDTAITTRTVATLLLLYNILTWVGVGSSKDIEGYSTNIKSIEKLVRAWAPLIWLAPFEKYLPSGIDEFLNHVYPSDSDGKVIGTQIPQGRESIRLHLRSKDCIDELLKQNETFLHGKDPSKTRVPVYAVVTSCKNPQSTNGIYNDENDNIQQDETNEETDLHFHVSYWLFFPYNLGKLLCILGRVPVPILYNTCFGKRKILGNHLADFEHVSMSFRGRNHPDEIYMQAHDSGAYYRFNEESGNFDYVRKSLKKGIATMHKYPLEAKMVNGRLQLFSALGSHGIWAEPGEHYIWRLPSIVDYSGYGTAWKTWNHLQIHHVGISEQPDWMKFAGKWGHSKSSCVKAKFCFLSHIYCEFIDGPPGILNRTNDFYC